MMHATAHAENLFTKYQDINVLITSKKYARWTIAQIFPDETSDYLKNRDNENRKVIERDFQSKGAMLVNSLTSKIMGALFPQNFAFFSIYPTKRMVDAMVQMGVDAKQVDAQLSVIAQQAADSVLVDGAYSVLNNAIKMLIITGNALLYRDPTNKKFYVYSVRDYVVKRDGSGNVLLIVLKESIPNLDIQEYIPMDGRDLYDSTILYTKVERVKINANGKVRYVYKVTQEIEGGIQVGEPSIYPESLCPYIPLTWSLLTGEHYGRGYIEDYAGDFARLSNLSEASLVYEVEAMRLLHIVDASASISVEDFNDVNSGDYITATYGSRGQSPILAYDGGEANKMQVVQQDISNIIQQLSIAFMYTGNTRDAERVTAEEIRANIQEANQTLGGVYSNISDILHTRLANILVAEVDPRMLPLMIEDSVGIDLLVGIAALNQTANVTRLQYVSNALQLILPVLTQSSARFNPDLIIDQVCAGYGVDRNSLSYTAEELQQIQQQQQQQLEQAQAQQQQQAQNTIQPQQQQAQLNSQQVGLT